MRLLDSYFMHPSFGKWAMTFGALVKGFSVTFRNMFRKTVTENYPYEPVHFQPRYRGIHVLHRDESGLENALAASFAPPPAPRTAFTSKPRKTRMRRGSPRASATPACITSIIRGAFFAVIAWKPARRTPSRTAMASSSRPTTSTRWFTGKNNSSKKNPPLRLRLHVNLLPS